MENEQLISAGEFSRKTGLSRKTLRGYEEIGLLQPELVDPANGFRYYTVEQLELGQLLGELRSANVPRSQLVEIVSALGDGMESPADAAETIKTFLYREAKVLRDHQATVHRVIDQLSYQDDDAGYEVLVRKAPAQMSLVGFEVCDATTIDAAAAKWAAILHEHAEGAAGGPLFMRFLEPVTIELAGKVEFGLPLREAVVPPEGCALQHSGERSEATMVISSAEDPYPQIRSALETILQWHLRNENDILGSAPEVHTNTPSENHLTVAWPFR